MAPINIINLTFSYDSNPEFIFKDFSCTLDTDWRLGLTGRNGKGKTTLLKLLSNQLEYSGQVKSPKNFMYFPFEINPSETVEMAAHKLLADYAQWKLVKELSLLDLNESFIQRTFQTLSGGEKTKALLALLFLMDNIFPLIDEPTNHLDTEGRRITAEYLSKKEGFILVSHDRNFLDSCTDHTMSINRSTTDIQKGNFSAWMYNKALKDSFETATNERLEKSINRLSASAKQLSGWSDKTEKTKYASRNSGLRPDRGFIGHKAAKVMKKAKNTERRINKELGEKSVLLKDIERAETLVLSPLVHPSEILCDIKTITIKYENTTVLQNFNLAVRKNEKIALMGKNGSGKSSILKSITGEIPLNSGSITLASSLKIAYIPQDFSHLKGSLWQYASKIGAPQDKIRTILRKMDFPRGLFSQDMSFYSAGQKKKVLLAGSLATSAHLYIWDEPLNYIDIYSRMQIEALLKATEMTIIFVEHDKRFCESIATQSVIL